MITITKNKIERDVDNTDVVKLDADSLNLNGNISTSGTLEVGSNLTVNGTSDFRNCDLTNIKEIACKKIKVTESVYVEEM